MADNLTHFFEAARNLAVDMLRREATLTVERISEIATKAAQCITTFNTECTVDIGVLTAELRHMFSVSVEKATILDDHDPTAHVPWLLDRRASLKWRFWSRYMRYLERDFGMPVRIVNELDALTDDILGRLEEPSREGRWNRRGMVVGSVQSGKTANYTGLICKAVDAGYKLIIVLAGIHNNLRSQTQLRLDEGVLGFDTQKSRKLNADSRWIGVGTFGDKLHIHSLTSSADNGDFLAKVAENVGVMLGSDPVVLVVKKNSPLLANLLKWVKHVAASDDSTTGQKIVRNVPLLLIDDEADNASINTKKGSGSESDSVTAINQRIREILSLFEKSAYVGYTATPFANIFINPQAQTPRLGEDIFPRSFIINVKAPSNYIGPAKVFGLNSDPDAGIAGEPGLPIVRMINDHDVPESFPRHKKDHTPTVLPPSLKEALRCFILACAARRARGQENKHNSMLVHVTRFVDVQDKVVRLLWDELRPLQRRIEFGDGARKPSLIDELRDLWEHDFVPVAQSLPEPEPPVTWDQVSAELHAAAAKIVVLPINGFAKEVLDYKDHEAKGLSVIAVGGDKLSRGLTLEGLSVSYFLRTSKMYDTLMQMGRWFGYRPGYLDLCRLYTTGQLVSWYRHIALAEIELRREFDYMVRANRTPEDYGLRVRTHPDGMIVTALNKMCHTEKLELSWSGVLVQTTHLPKDASRIAANLAALERLLGRLDPAKKQPDQDALGSKIWKDVEAGPVADFIESVKFPPEAIASAEDLAAFIRAQAAKESPELTSWTVALVSSRQAPQTQQRSIGPFTVGLVTRTPESQTADSLALRNANIKSPLDESLDLAHMPLTPENLSKGQPGSDLSEELGRYSPDPDKVLFDVALDITRRRGAQDAKVPSGRVVREIRPKRCALLLIYPIVPAAVIGDSQSTPTGLHPSGTPILGVAISFPVSDTVKRVEYRVNRVWDLVGREDESYED